MSVDLVKELREGDWCVRLSAHGLTRFVEDDAPHRAADEIEALRKVAAHNATVEAGGEAVTADLVKELRAATMRFDWGDLPDDAAIPAVPLLRRAADEIEALRKALEVTAGNVRSLGPAGALAAVHMPYREWLAIVDAALSGGQP